MAWRRKAKLVKRGRPRKPGPRHPGGQRVRQQESPGPTPELLKRRCDLFGSADVQAETDRLIDRLWGKRVIDDRERAAAQRLDGLYRAVLAGAGAPKPASFSYGQVRRGGGGDADDPTAEYRCALGALDRLGPGIAALALDACCFSRLTPARLPELRVALAALAAHFSMPAARRLKDLTATSTRGMAGSLP